MGIAYHCLRAAAVKSIDTGASPAEGGKGPSTGQPHIYSRPGRDLTGENTAAILQLSSASRSTASGAWYRKQELENIVRISLLKLILSSAAGSLTVEDFYHLIVDYNFNYPRSSHKLRSSIVCLNHHHLPLARLS